MRGLVEAGGYAYKSADGIEYLAKLRKADATAIQGQVAALRELEAVMSAASAKQREMASQQNFLANLTRELVRRDGRYGLETMCIGGGQGIAAIFERAA